MKRLFQILALAAFLAFSSVSCAIYNDEDATVVIRTVPGYYPDGTYVYPYWYRPPYYAPRPPYRPRYVPRPAPPRPSVHRPEPRPQTPPHRPNRPTPPSQPANIPDNPGQHHAGQPNKTTYGHR